MPGTMKIKISDRPAIKAALKAANGLAYAHVLTDAAEIEAVAKRAEARFDASGIPQRMRVGTTLTFRSGGAPSRRNAKWTNTRTVSAIKLYRAASGWVLTEITTATVWPGNAEVFDLTVSAEVRERVIRAALDGIKLKAA